MHTSRNPATTVLSLILMGASTCNREIQNTGHVLSHVGSVGSVSFAKTSPWFTTVDSFEPCWMCAGAQY